MALSARLLALRGSPFLYKLPPYLSALCVLVGIGWILLLPLNEYSRQTYVSENAILPGQVHTYFGGSEHNIFRAFRQEVYALSQQSEDARQAGVLKVLADSGLKTASQPYAYQVAGESINGTNVYGILQGPRADATEAMVLLAAWRNFDDQINYSGVALALTLARYFSRWSIWSKDIILLIPSDSTYGPLAWVDAYHSICIPPTASRNISAVPLKAGALQAAVALDYPAGPWGQRFSSLDILYDGLNGALPNLDLLNTAVSIASGQMGIACTLHNHGTHSDSYRDRLSVLGSGLATQSLGHATGPHSAFIPYHVDAITLKTVGDGWHDEMSLGRVTESVFRSINNLLEHLHQSFFFYILLNANRFVSVGNYLPAAMVLAGSFTISALGLWVLSGRDDVLVAPLAGGMAKEKVEMETVKLGSDVALVPRQSTRTIQRELFVPALSLLGVHILGYIPLWLMTSLSRENLLLGLRTTTAVTLLLPLALAATIRLTRSQAQMLQSLSLILLGALLATLATLNFSLALVLGVLAAPLAFVRRSSSALVAAAQGILLAVTSPPVAVYALQRMFYPAAGLEKLLLELAKGWSAQGVWLLWVVWGVWWPAWIVGGVVVGSGVMSASSEPR
ncbi:hypothetical protein B0A48_06944 [Cryoendolithus antarcticus]|uniref:GPI transamidase component GAA1 n=1 Tax=Cryoendolithus antarcticus TaxID=1507870 RepID=A0A1V8T9X1_9PEZI|nr:hypothetical protein B0A48_06944 [Cryoendolithus antarcticus]